METTFILIWTKCFLKKDNRKQALTGYLILKNYDKGTKVTFFFFLSYTIFIYLFIYPWLRWASASARGPSPVAGSGGHSSSQCAGPPPSRPLPSRSTSSRRAGSATVAHGPSHSTARGILPDQGPNPCPPHWQADSQPLRHQGSPRLHFLKKLYLF